MASAARIDLPQAPPPRWSRGDIASALVASGAVLALGGWGAWEPAHLPLTLGLAAPFLIFTLILLVARGAASGKSAWALARRAQFSRPIDRFLDRGPWLTFLASLAVAILGVTLAVFDLPDYLQATVPALLALLVLFVVGIVAARVVMVIAARHFMRRLSTTTLAHLEGDDGHVELALQVSPDAPALELPFLEGRFACVQLRYGAGLDSVHTWPERLSVSDATGSAELALGSFEICGWRSKNEVVTWDEERSALVARMEKEVGRPLAGPKSTSASYAVWAIEPGDRIYVVGEAEEVRRGLGTYRGAGSTTLGSRSDLSAVAVLGDENTLETTIGRELRYQLLVAAVTLASLSLLIAATAALVP